MGDRITAYDVLCQFAEGLQQNFEQVGDFGAEEQLKTPVSALITALGKIENKIVRCTPESFHKEFNIHPDIAISIETELKGALICGYIELKKPGLGGDPTKLKSAQNKEQWVKMKNLPNLIYCDGQQWGLYRHGERVGDLVRFDGRPDQLGKAAIGKDTARQLDRMIVEFLGWQPIVPHRAEGLAEYLAPLVRRVRDEVAEALKNPESNISYLRKDWGRYFLPNTDNTKFADAYAQTMTYALLLARLQGAKSLEPDEAAKTLNDGNGLLAETLTFFGRANAQKDLPTSFSLVRRSLEALDPHEFLKTKPDLWLYFYEEFLAAYDPKLREDYGVYYTPHEVVALQVRLISELLKSRFGKQFGFADAGVMFLDPAVGTGTYLVEAITQSLGKVEEEQGAGTVESRAQQLADNMYGFEILVGPYAVAHLRLTQALALPKQRLQIYLADTLENPKSIPPAHLPFPYIKLNDEHEAARAVKNEGDIVVCLGNPPYDRQTIEQGDDITDRKGGWVRFGDAIKGRAKQEKQGIRPILQDFIEPVSKAGAGVHLKNIYNDYVYFWRWALWRMFEQQDRGGIISFITAASYLRGPGFIGMREVMRRTFDELWIIDLGGDSRSARQTPNVFNIQTPVAIAIGMRGKTPNPKTPATVYYLKITANSREAKLAELARIENFANVAWQEVSSDWHAPFIPQMEGRFFDWPRLDDIFPLALSGVQYQRTWPIGENKAVLKKRWRTLSQSPTGTDSDERKTLFRETRDRKIETVVKKTSLPGGGAPALASLDATAPLPPCIRYGWRSFDRHYALYDTRLGDYLRPVLYALYSRQQIYLIAKFNFVMGQGPALIASPHIPDINHFRGDHGGKDVIPLYRDRAAQEGNITTGLLETISKQYYGKKTPARNITTEDLAAYCYALLGGRNYTEVFYQQLETPGPRVPITKDKILFAQAVALGRKLLSIHCYGERMAGEANQKRIVRCTKGVDGSPENYPEAYGYNRGKKTIWIGKDYNNSGHFAPVAAEIWDYDISGLKVVQSWLGYRMKKRKGKKSSPLDAIRPESWDATLNTEFLELIGLLEASRDLEPQLATMLEKITAGECFTTAELPQPSDADRKPPKIPPHDADSPDKPKDDLITRCSFPQS